MRLLFRWYKRDSMEHNLLGQRCARLWQEHNEAIVRAFEEETGLKFVQRAIQVRVIDGESNSGWYRKPMRISTWYTDDDTLIATMTHELAHRLLSGHDMWRPYKSKARGVQMHHRHIYLFLYDVWANAFGKETADRLAADERAKTKTSYHSAWDWAMGKSYAERKKALERVKLIRHPDADNH